MITGDFVNGLHLMVGTTSDLDANSKPNVATTSENTFFLVEDSGTVFYYSGGEWAQAGDDVAMIIASILGGGSELPVVDASDNGKVLGVSNGAWAVVSGGGGSADAVLYTAQTLSDLQKAQARTNIGAGTYSKPSGGIPWGDLSNELMTSIGKAENAVRFDSQSLTSTQQAQARTNIGAGEPLNPTDIANATSDWLDENITNPSNPPIDTSLSVLGAAADAKVTGDKINAVEAGLNMESAKHVFSVTLEAGAINSSGVPIDDQPANTGYWLRNSCRSNDYVDITGFESVVSELVRVAGAGTGDAAHWYNYIFWYDSSKAYISRSGGTDEETVEATIPANAKYIKVGYTYTKLSDVDTFSVYTTGIDYEAIAFLKEIQDANVKTNIPVEFEVGAVASSTGADASSSYDENSCRSSDYVDIAGFDSLVSTLKRRTTAVLPSGVPGFYHYVLFYDASKVFISSSTGGLNSTTVSIDVPANAKYVRISLTYSQIWDIEEYTLVGITTEPLAENVAGVNESTFENGNAISQLSVKSASKGIVLGDSIAWGLYSYFDGGSRKNTNDKTSVYTNTRAAVRISDWFSRFCGVPVDNVAERGTGYVADTRSLGNAWVKAQATDFSDYDFVLLCFGVNDYIQMASIGTIADNAVGTVIGNMIHTLNKIYTDNPLCKVVVYSPFNTWGQWRDSQGATQVLYGDEASNYALGYNMGSGLTLQDYIDAIDEVCQHYGVLHVSCTDGSICNRFNIKNIMIDGLHPSEESMRIIAGEMFARANLW